MNTDTFPQKITESDGHTTCLMHRQWEWTMKNYVPTMSKCNICGGVVDTRLAAHALCVSRRGLNLATPRLDAPLPQCSCRPCVLKRQG